MQFPNAYNGVSKIFIAEILALIGALVVLAGAGLMVGGAATALNGSAEVGGGLAIGGAITTLGGLVLPLVGYILQLVGLSQASKDEQKNFKIAFIAAILALVFSVVSGFVSSIGWLSSALTVASGIANICIFVYTIAGIMELANRLNRPEIAALGNKILWMVVIAYAVSFVVKLIPIVELAVVLAVASGVLAIVTYVVFLVYLSKAKKMLAA